MWRKEDCNDLIHGDCLVNPRAAATLEDLATDRWLSGERPGDRNAGSAIRSGRSNQAVPGYERQLHPRDLEQVPADFPDANVATIEVAAADAPGDCAPLTPVFNTAFNVNVW